MSWLTASNFLHTGWAKKRRHSVCYIASNFRNTAQICTIFCRNQSRPDVIMWLWFCVNFVLLLSVMNYCRASLN